MPRLIFIDALTYQVVTPPEPLDPDKYPKLCDPDDLPISAPAVKAKCESLITGYKDLLVITSPLLRVVSLAEFFELRKSDHAAAALGDSL